MKQLLKTLTADAFRRIADYLDPAPSHKGAPTFEFQDTEKVYDIPITTVDFVGTTIMPFSSVCLDPDDVVGSWGLPGPRRCRGVVGSWGGPYI